MVPDENPNTLDIDQPVDNAARAREYGEDAQGEAESNDKPAQEVSAESQARQAQAEKRAAFENELRRQALLNDKEKAAEAAGQRPPGLPEPTFTDEQLAHFRTTVAVQFASMPAVLRVIAYEEMSKIQGVDAPPVPVPNNDLAKNEAAKIQRAVADVAPRSFLAAAVAPEPEQLDGKWRIPTGVHNGHLMHRWLSPEEVERLGLNEVRGSTDAPTDPATPPSVDTKPAGQVLTDLTNQPRDC